MYMGVIPKDWITKVRQNGAPHVYGGDPLRTDLPQG